MAAKFSLATEEVKVASKPTEVKTPVVEDAPKVVIDESPVEPKAPVVAAPTVPEKKYKVLADAKVQRGGGSFTLRAGKVISEHGYDIEFLKSSKVQLEEVVQP
jgi:hypothetical protein